MDAMRDYFPYLLVNKVFQGETLPLFGFVWARVSVCVSARTKLCVSQEATSLSEPLRKVGHGQVCRIQEGRQNTGL